MEHQVIQTLTTCIENNIPVALVTVIANTGSSPGKPGAIMTVQPNGETCGTIGGGNLEHQVIAKALGCLENGESTEMHYSLSPGGDLGMRCGGELRLFIRVFGNLPQLVIVGAGHIGLELYQLALQQHFEVVVIDDRPDLLNSERFSRGDKIVTDDIPQAISALTITPNTFITIATRSHELDKLALAAATKTDAPYIGMIGSRQKVRHTFNYLLEQGIAKEKIAKLYAPMGLDIASILPREIALSIMSEILLVKNKGSLQHMRQVKDAAAILAELE
ncbi:XdhC family protein [Desulfosediminicola sp.]|uniref:XdhC family protein n=1 Tax=Desulfosediminicola sp. TaxID=2886825 RepID=UPI003AF22A79